eukprot:95068_1
MSTENENNPNISGIADLLMPIDRQFSWMNQDIFVTEQDNDDIDEFNKKYTELKPINKTIAIDAYVHIICKCNNKIPNEIIMCIIDFWNINDSYFEILCDENKHIIHDNSIKKLKLSTLKCSNCLKKHCLEFKQSYNEDLHPNEGKFCHTFVNTMDINNTMNRYKNIGNEYQCRKCKYYTLFNVKMKVISYLCMSTDTEQLDISYHFVTPFKPNKNGKYINCYNNINKDSESERNWIKCAECYGKFVIIVQFNYMEIKTHECHIIGNKEYKNVYGTSSEYIYYCNVCDLFTYKGHNKLCQNKS